MKILLVNPNRFRKPPAPPIGLECIAGALEQAGHEVRILDLCFSTDICADMDAAVAEFSPDMAGISVRNIDSVLYYKNEFYLDEIRDIVHYLKTRHSLRVMAGGTGLLAGPEAVTDYLGADYGIAGPAEESVICLLSEVQAGHIVNRIRTGSIRPYSACSRQSSGIDYQKYYLEGGIAGFETHKGCSSSCVYCLEANSPVSFKRNEDVLQEIKGFVEMGFNRFHLCDPEFNEDLDHSLEFCSALKKSGLKIEWAVYMKPANYNQKLFRLMKDTGVNLITLTVDSFKKCPLYWADTEKMVFNAQANGIPLVVDFLTGFPYEDEELLKWCLDFFRRLQPDRVNINTYIRLYRSLTVSKIIMKDPALLAYMTGETSDDTMIRPVFFSNIVPEKLSELIDGDPLFRIELTGAGVNYTRAGG